MRLKVLTFNCWAIGYVPFMSQDNHERIRAIAQYLANEKTFDVVCLQEVWCHSDQKWITEACKEVLPYANIFYG